ncbi:hypothetical protein [Megasphaera elsdenii]|uniref:hypothetical protein n=1 Tax=Megasphaera elsdenii TaxID=907 RepID=UPI0039F58D03
MFDVAGLMFDVKMQPATSNIKHQTSNFKPSEKEVVHKVNNLNVATSLCYNERQKEAFLWIAMN